jgi:hypothetical protein
VAWRQGHNAEQAWTIGNQTEVPPHVRRPIFVEQTLANPRECAQLEPTMKRRQL